MGLGGVISNLISLGAKLRPAVKAFASQAPSSSSSSSQVREREHQIEAELEQLMRMLEQIKATLYDAEQREIRDATVKLFLNELKQVALQAEDVLDEHHYEVLRAQVEARDAPPPDSSIQEEVPDAKGSKRKEVEESDESMTKVLDDLFAQIQQIRSRFAEIEKDRKALKLSDKDGPRLSNSQMQIAPTSYLVVESNIFGREIEKKDLIDLLSPKCHDNVVSVVAIVGMGGIGKTTLAQLAYNYHLTERTFDKFGWVCVSEDFNVERLTKESLEYVTEISCGLTNLSALQTKIVSEIKGKRVLLVIDDVWNEEECLWESFLTPFMSAKLAKILVTTRNDRVAQIMKTEPTVKLGYLSEAHSWQLFKHYAFHGVKQLREDPKLIEIGKKIMNKCGMLPLAVKSIANLLRHNVEENSWREILESELWESSAKNKIYPSLQISYVHLPIYLKPILIYCSLFPKDHEYNVEHMVRLAYGEIMDFSGLYRGQWKQGCRKDGF